MTSATSLAQRLADTAAGTWGEEAAVWLLDRHGHWLPELERLGLIQNRSTADGDEALVIAWPTVDMLRHDAELLLIGTNSERQVLDVARALATYIPCGMNWLTALDETNRRLVLHAIAWAAGGRDWAESLCLTGPDNCVCSADAD